MAQPIILKGKILQFYNGCPKPNGWFGCFFEAKGMQSDIRLTGKTDLKLDKGMHLLIEAHTEDYNGVQGYVADKIEIITKGRDALVRYLSGPSFKDVGRVRASKIYDMFGDNTIDVITNSPDDLKKCNIPDDLIKVLHNGVINASIENTLKREFLMLTPKLITELIDVYDNKAVEILRNNPYQTIYRCSHMTFNIADAIALQVGTAMDSHERIMECFQYVIHDMFEKSGDVCADLSDSAVCQNIVDTVMKQLRYTVDITKVIDGLNDIGNMKNIVVVHEDDSYFLYTRTLYDAEIDLSDLISKLLVSPIVYNATKAETYRYIDEYEDLTGISLDFDQRLAVINGLYNRLSIIKGGPGKGKTADVDCILYCWKKSKGKRPILAAPTGRASRRLTQAVSKLHNYKAQTIMRQLVTADCVKEGTYDDTLIIIDECSMIGLVTAARMFDLYKNSQIVLVGDANQLPSIESGQVFKDLCDMAIIPQTTLTVCYRAHGGRVLIDNADKIQDGQLCDKLDYQPNVFDLWQFNEDGALSQQFIVDRCLDAISQGTALSEICVLCPTHNGATGVRSLNLVLQNALNPLNTKKNSSIKGCEIADTFYGNKEAWTRFRVGDRVMQTVNRTDAEYDLFEDGKYVETGTGIYNGDCGTIIAYNNDDQLYIVVEMDDGRKYTIESEFIDELTLAYAMTVHKSQGCEYDVVIFSAQCCLTNSWFVAHNFATRNLFYTAVTRAKRAVCIVGSVTSVNICIETEVANRNSRLTQRILENV